MVARSIGVAVLLICLPALGQKREPVDTSICSIAAHPSKFHDKYVRVRGTASSGMEASILIDFKDGKWRKECGRINLEFGSAGSDESTARFLRLFGEQITPPKCDSDERLMQGFRNALDPSTPAPPSCSTFTCIFCPRYSIVATFTGKVRYFAMEHRQVGFGHAGMFSLQLDVTSVSDLDVTDTAAHPKP
jgi:hypothetical protein